MSQSNDELSPQAQADLQRLLQVSDPMPDAVWARLNTAIEAEAAGRRPRGARGSRWLTGLAAAAVLVVAGAVVWPALQPDAPGPVAAPMMAATPQAAGDVAALRTAPVSGLPVVESGTDYRTATIDDSVIRLASNVVPDDTPTAGEDGFTATAEALTECVAALLLLAESPDPQPLVVDRARLDGREVGVLVLAPTGQRFEVFVVDLGCSAQDPGVRLHRWVSAS